MEFKVVGFMGSYMFSAFLTCKKVSFSEALAWGALDSDSGLWFGDGDGKDLRLEISLGLPSLGLRTLQGNTAMCVYMHAHVCACVCMCVYQQPVE